MILSGEERKSRTLRPSKDNIRVTMRLRNKLHSIWPYALALLFAVALAGCGMDEDAPAPGGNAALTGGDVASGETLFTSKGCSGCHGADASGGLGPNIQGASADIIIAVAGTDQMAGATVTTQEAADLAALLATDPTGWNLGGGLDGASLYVSKGCSGCHGADASGGIGPDIQGQTAAMILVSVGTGTMAGLSVTAEEADAIGTWLQTLP